MPFSVKKSNKAVSTSTQQQSTPARKLFQKLFCTSSAIKTKQSLVSATSHEDIPSDSSGSPLSKRSPSEQAGGFPSLSHETSICFDDEDGAQGFFPPPDLSRQFHMSDSMQNASLRQTPQGKRAALSSPQRLFESHDQAAILPMNNTPGLAIPTPQTKSTDYTVQTTVKAATFPHPLKTVSESPLVSKLFESSPARPAIPDDDEAFLPDDFAASPLATATGERTYSLQQVQEMIRQAEEQLRSELQAQHDQAMEDFEQAVESQLRQHGTQWKNDAEAEYRRLGSLLKEEQNRTLETEKELRQQTAQLHELQQEMDRAKSEDDSRIAELETKLSTDSEAARELYRYQMEEQIKAKQLELEALHDGDLEALQSRIAELEHELKEAAPRAAELETQLRDVRNQVDSSSVEEVILLKGEKAAHERQVQELKQQLVLKNETDKNLRTLLNEAQERAMQLEEKLSNETAELQKLKAEAKQKDADSSNKANESHDVSLLASQRDELLLKLKQKEDQAQEIDALTKQVTRELEAEIALEKSQRSSLQTEKDELSAQIALLEQKIEDLATQHLAECTEAKELAKRDMENELHQLKEIVLRKEQGNDSLRKRVADLQAKADADRMEYNHQVQAVRTEHAGEINELVSQLDLVEAEHKQGYETQVGLVKEKEAVIAALGTQFADAEARLEKESARSETLTAEIVMLTRELDRAKLETKNVQQQMRQLETDHKHALEEEELLRETACEEIRETTIQAAEAQYQTANDRFKKLKQGFDDANARISELEAEILVANNAREASKNKYEKRELDLRDELAKAKAAVAKNDLQASRNLRQARAELASYKEKEASLQSQLEAAQATSQSVQKTLAQVLSEKEKLNVEFLDMKSVCEDLLLEIENRQGQL